MSQRLSDEDFDFTDPAHIGNKGKRKATERRRHRDGKNHSSSSNKKGHRPKRKESHRKSRSSENHIHSHHHHGRKHRKSKTPRKGRSSSNKPFNGQSTPESSGTPSSSATKQRKTPDNQLRIYTLDDIDWSAGDPASPALDELRQTVLNLLKDYFQQGETDLQLEVR